MPASSLLRSPKLVAVGLALLVAVVPTACTSGDDDPSDALDLGADAVEAADLPPIELDDDVLDLSLETFDGATLRLADVAGPIVVNFWSSSCVPCVDEMPEFEAVHQELGGSVTFVGINTTDRPSDADEFAAATGVTYTLLRDPDGVAAEAFGLFALPATIVFDAEHRPVDLHTGQMTATDLRTAIQAATA